MATFPRGHSAAKPYKPNVIRVRLEAVTTIQAKGWAYTTSDHRTLRGIPAIGPGVGGAIHNTRPDLAITYVIRPGG